MPCEQELFWSAARTFGTNPVEIHEFSVLNLLILYKYLGRNKILLTMFIIITYSRCKRHLIKSSSPLVGHITNFKLWVVRWAKGSVKIFKRLVQRNFFKSLRSLSTKSGSLLFQFKLSKIRPVTKTPIRLLVLLNDFQVDSIINLSFPIILKYLSGSTLAYPDITKPVRLPVFYWC